MSSISMPVDMVYEVCLQLFKDGKFEDIENVVASNKEVGEACQHLRYNYEPLIDFISKLQRGTDLWPEVFDAVCINLAYNVVRDISEIDTDYGIDDIQVEITNIYRHINLPLEGEIDTGTSGCMDDIEEQLSEPRTKKMVELYLRGLPAESPESFKEVAQRYLDSH